MEQQVVIGSIIAPHGVRGEFRLIPLTENPEQFLQLKYLLLEGGRKLTILGARFHKNILLVKVAEVNSMDEAELLRGKKVLINSADLPPLQADQFYVADLLGFVVFDENNEVLGKLKDIITTGSNDVFVIADATGKEILVPALKANVQEINMAEQRVSVILPKWAD
ncbi:MAG: ribosome maturation factor RimM [Acidaminococcaceae bacterium]